MPHRLLHRLQRARARLAEVSRVNLWWDNKLCPILASMYATGLLLDLRLTSMWATLVTVIVAISAEAVFATVLNDLTDRADDRRAGKENRLAGKSTPFLIAIISLPLFIGAAFAVAWRSDIVVVLLYLTGWLCFFLYSVNPVRLKQRGFAGVLADAFGAHLLTTMLAAVVVHRSAGQALDQWWLLTLGTWALACGVRNATSHQINDRANDLRIGLNSFATRYRPEQAAWFGTYILFPIELAALAAMIWRVGHPLPVVALVAYGVLTFLRYKIWGLGLVIIEPKPRSFMALHGYYEAFLPVSLLLIAVLEHPADALILVAHLALFQRPVAEAVLNALSLIKMAVLRVLSPITDP